MRKLLLIDRIYRKVVKGLKITFGSLFGLVLLVVLLLQIPGVQNYIGQKVVAHFEDEWNTTFTVSEVSFGLFSVGLDTVYLEDQRGETLLAVDRLGARFNLFRLLNDKIDVSNFELEGGTVNLYREDEASGFNFDFIADYFAGEPDTTDTTTTIYSVEPVVLSLTDIQFSLVDKPGGLDWQSRIQHFYAHIETIDLENRLIALRELNMDNPDIGWVQGKGLAKPTPAGDEPLTELEGSPPGRLNPDDWKIQIGKMDINDGHFLYRDAESGEAPTPGLIDYSNLNLTNIHLSLQDLVIFGDTITSRIGHIGLADHSGFNLDTLRGDMRVSTTGIHLEEMLIKTDRSRIAEEVNLLYKSFDDFSDFVHKVRLETHFDKSVIALRDIDYFAPGLPLADDVYYLEGDITGTIDALKGRDLHLRYGEVTDLRGGFTTFGLPEIEETFMDFTVQSFQTNRDELVKLLPTVTLPEKTRMLGNVQFSGNFTGFLSDFVAKGALQTKIGYIESDINMKIPGGDKEPTYSGTLLTRNFQLGRWLDDPLLGTVSFSSEINGRSFETDQLVIEANGTVQHLDFNDYRYKGIKVDGELKQRAFTGNLSIKDPNIALDFSGTADFDSTEPVFDLVADVGFLRMKQLNLIEEDYKIKTKIEAHFSGTNLDDLVGTIKLKNTEFYTDQHFYPIGEVSLTAEQYELGKRVTLESTLADGMLDGKFNLSELPATFIGYFSNYYPSVLSLPNANASTSDMDFMFHFEIKKASQLTDLIIPEVKSEPGTSVSGNFNSAYHRLMATVNLPYIEYEGIKAINSTVSITGSPDTLDFEAQSEKVLITGDIGATYKIDGSVYDNNVYFNLKVYEDSLLDQLFANAIFTNKGDSIQLRLLDSRIQLAGETWQIDETNELRYYQENLFANNLMFTNGPQHVSFTTDQNAENQTDLNVSLEQFHLQHLLDIIGFADYRIDGAIIGELDVSNVLTDHRKIEVDARMEDFSVEGDTMGTLTFRTTYDFDADTMNLNTHLDAHIGTFTAAGRATQLGSDPQLDFRVQARQTPFKILEPFLQDLLSDLDGRMEGQFTVYGPASNPEVNGEINIKNGAARFDYLNTLYYFETIPIVFTKKSIFIKETQMHDTEARTGSKATLGGEIYFDNLSSFTFEDVYVYTDRNFKFMETTRAQNEQFYGTAYGKGIVQVNGPLDNLDVYVQASSDPGTVINIPIIDETGVSQHEFIRFRSKDTTDPANLLGQVTDYGFTLTMDLAITRDAETRLIFNEQTGEVMRGRGEGNLKITMDRTGDLAMYGNYTIVEGDYLFRLQDVITKKFSIQRGGTVRWSGDPYDAMLDVSAVYSRKVSRYDLVSDLADQLTAEEIQNLRRPVQVDVYLNMTGSLSNPNITFDIEVDDRDQSLVNVFQNRLRELERNENELNKQVFGLIVFNRFLPPSVGATGTGGGGILATGRNTLTDFVSNQASIYLTDWLSRYDMSVNVNYRSYDYDSEEATTLRNELELDLAKRLGRVTINVGGNYGFGAEEVASANALAGDFSIEYDLTPDGRVRVKAFQESEYDIFEQGYVGHSGVGIFFRKEFNSFNELFTNPKKQREKEAKEEQSEPEDNNEDNANDPSGGPGN